MRLLMYGEIHGLAPSSESLRKSVLACSRCSRSLVILPLVRFALSIGGAPAWSCINAGRTSRETSIQKILLLRANSCAIVDFPDPDTPQIKNLPGMPMLAVSL